MTAGNLILADAASATSTAPVSAPAQVQVQTPVSAQAGTLQPDTAPGTEAKAQQPGLAEGLMQFAPFIIIIVVMFYLMYRGQKKEQKRRQDMIESVKKGDSVLTIGGLMGEVVELKDDSFIVKIADNVKVKFAKSAIAKVNSADEAPKK